MPNSSAGLNWITRPDGAGTWLVDNLQANRWDSFRACVAFLKNSGLRHIAPSLHAYLASGGTASVTVGLSSGGTSAEGLESLWRILEDFEQPLYVVHESRSSVSFHPKAYVFSSARKSCALVGSANLTEGGLFSNHELSAAFDWNHSDAASKRSFDQLSQVLDEWQTPSPYCLEVTSTLLQRLYDDGLLPREAQIRPPRPRPQGATSPAAPRPAVFGSSNRVITPPVAVQPASSTAAALDLPPLEPRSSSGSGSGSGSSSQAGGAVAATGPTGQAPAQPHAPRSVLVMEVRPHHNGEVFLSYRAVRDDNPDFLDYPFTGWTTPKRANNNPYPQMSPDPIVSITVYDASGSAVHGVVDHPLNVVDYETKREIRVTIPAHVVSHIPEMSVLVMTKDPSTDLDYFLEFYPPNTAPAVIEAAMTEKLPSGGAGRGRRYGWI